MPLAGLLRPAQILGGFQQKRPVDHGQGAIARRPHLVGQHAVLDFPRLVNVANRGVDQGLNSRIGDLDAIVGEAAVGPVAHGARRSASISAVSVGPRTRGLPRVMHTAKDCSPAAGRATGSRRRRSFSFSVFTAATGREQATLVESPTSTCWRFAAAAIGDLRLNGDHGRDRHGRIVSVAQTDQHNIVAGQTSLPTRRRRGKGLLIHLHLFPTTRRAHDRYAGRGQLLLHPFRGNI